MTEVLCKKNIIFHKGFTPAPLTITKCKYTVLSYLDIGKLYSLMIEDCAEPGYEVDELMKKAGYLLD